MSFSKLQMVFSENIIIFASQNKIILENFHNNLIFKISIWEKSFLMNKHNQKAIDMFNKQDLMVY